MVTLRSCFPMLPHCLPAGTSCQQQIPDGSSPQRPCQQHLPDDSSQQSPCHQHLPDGSSPQRPCQQQLCHGAPASSIFPMALRHGAPASNKPHLTEKSTPVWLAIWRTWAGFANSQLLPDAAAGALSRALGAESSAERQLFRWKHLSAG